MSVLQLKDFASRHRETILWCLSSAAIAAYFALRWLLPPRSGLATTQFGYPSVPTQGEYAWTYRLSLIALFATLASIVFTLWLEDAE